MARNARKDIEKIIAKRRESNNLRNIPVILIPIWQIKLRERLGMDVDKELVYYIVQAVHEEGTWKRQRAIKNIESILMKRGYSTQESELMAKRIIEMATST
ncbi:hypothetical protein [Caldiplasma sukawensis]